MTRGAAFVIGDALRRSLSRPLPLVLWMTAIAGALLGGTALLLTPAVRGGVGTAVEAFLLAELGATSSEAAVARLGAGIWTWSGVDAVVFRFSGETDPVAIEGRTLVVRLLSPEARASVEARLRALPEVVGVRYHQRRAGRAQVPLATRILTLVVLVGALSWALWQGHRAVAGAEALWGRELALLRSCGASPALRRAPFFALGALVGAGAGGLYVGACWALWTWGRAAPYLRDVVPAFPLVWGGLVTGGLALGIGLGLLGSLVAAVASSHS